MGVKNKAQYAWGSELHLQHCKKQVNKNSKDKKRTGNKSKMDLGISLLVIWLSKAVLVRKVTGEEEQWRERW